MRKIILLLSFVLVLSGTFGSVSVIEPPKLNAANVMIPVGKTGKKISLLELSKISMKDLQELTGKKMNFFERIAYKSAQNKLRKSINADGTIDNKKLNKFLSKSSTGNAQGFHAVGFLLGFLLWLIGVLLAYVINDDEDKRNRVKWAWIGFGVSFVLYIVLIVLILSASFV